MDANKLLDLLYHLDTPGSGARGKLADYLALLESRLEALERRADVLEAPLAEEDEEG